MNRCQEWGAPRVPVVTVRGGGGEGNDRDGARELVHGELNTRDEWMRMMLEKMETGSMKRVLLELDDSSEIGPHSTIKAKKIRLMEQDQDERSGNNNNNEGGDGEDASVPEDTVVPDNVEETETGRKMSETVVDQDVESVLTVVECLQEPQPKEGGVDIKEDSKASFSVVVGDVVANEAAGGNKDDDAAAVDVVVDVDTTAQGACNQKQPQQPGKPIPKSTARRTQPSQRGKQQQQQLKKLKQKKRKPEEKVVINKKKEKDERNEMIDPRKPENNAPIRKPEPKPGERHEEKSEIKPENLEPEPERRKDKRKRNDEDEDEMTTDRRELLVTTTAKVRGRPIKDPGRRKLSCKDARNLQRSLSCWIVRSKTAETDRGKEEWMQMLLPK